MDLTHWYDGTVRLVTRRYPVDLTRMAERMEADLQENFDFAIHVGQAPGSSHLRLESVALNLKTDGREIIPNGPSAYRCPVTLTPIAAQIRAAGIPARVSHHAGTYLCNAALYLSHHFGQRYGLRTKSVFVHVPLTPQQVARQDEELPSMSTPMTSAALAILLRELTTPVLLA